MKYLIIFKSGKIALPLKHRKNILDKTTRQTLICTERLLIRRPEKDDEGFLTRVFCDPEMMRYLGGAWDENETADSCQEWHDDWGKNKRWYGILCIKDTLMPIGTAGITKDTIQDEAGFELSWFILPAFQKQGYASEITQGLIKFVFEEIGAKRILAETHPENPASNRVLEKMAFSCLGERRHHYDYLPDFDVQVLWERLG